MKLSARSVLLFLALAAAACGDDSANPFVFDAGGKDATAAEAGRDAAPEVGQDAAGDVAQAAADAGAEAED